MYKTFVCNLTHWSRKNLLFSRYYSATSERKRVCIVGSGPAGFYTAQHLLKNKLIEVDIFEKLPVPFGLIRYGVAPDHPEIKNVTNSFTKLALNENCRFYGNINVGEDVKISELLNSYHAVVLAYGASCDKVIGIPGEDSKTVLPARRIVGWYTGHPDFVDEQIDLDTDVATIVGHGNVALDVARILLRNLDELKVTDISEYAYEALKKSKIRKVVLLGRRGPLQSAFSIKEFREMTKLTGCNVNIHDSIVKEIAANCKDLARPLKRMIELMTEIYDKTQSNSETQSRSMDVKFLRSPKEIIADSNGKVEKFVCRINTVKDLCDKKSMVEVTDQEDVINCGLVIRSVGYQSVPIESSIPFNAKHHIISNAKGRVKDTKGLYCSGWVKSGPIGVIVSTMHESFETGEALMEDIQNGIIGQDLPHDREYLHNLLSKKGVKVVTFKDWELINRFELDKGKEMGKYREKVYKVEDMLKFLKSS
ncbi:hypothetical protein JTE90_014108 [Oedothorax gibbosus]|uniref:NADPH:adrenodoxin oxidoreductase, mitochondrial n=1 Tax=Oedothorax gibbosus TaxID=931172 RepID=A0AAV6V687_9ARAC|nr:hypothetical protein JTE90_014108 [Oedothorax gibbosus]